MCLAVPVVVQEQSEFESVEFTLPQHTAVPEGLASL